MFYGSASAGVSGLIEANQRLFRYEVVGLRQSDQSDRRTFPIRKSGSVFVTVPYNRMNEEMRRITRLGGKIVGIAALGSANGQPG
ncbi:phycocyanin-associated 7.8kDa rod linker protein [Gloeomargarita lithophora Alchichica-D10]|uniref:Phycocyanin-associated 7.8kDa rod linker protein n=1 Tax=Gloeomargarita lithophora Alchichica-D10 TaxID=1188229 RepID=A0A1J0ABH9_9CYAN|nr:phycobilisome linker polypeptide [Gloeomargarita lithophora]APB33288.1 phycocyanin-associated 7.8kDa rod linker protein [Gloeomargarita lithophora Alchichica-D10]